MTINDIYQAIYYQLSLTVNQIEAQDDSTETIQVLQLTIAENL